VGANSFVGVLWPRFPVAGSAMTQRRGSFWSAGGSDRRPEKNITLRLVPGLADRPVHFNPVAEEKDFGGESPWSGSIFVGPRSLQLRWGRELGGNPPACGGALPLTSGVPLACPRVGAATRGGHRHAPSPSQRQQPNVLGASSSQTCYARPRGSCSSSAVISHVDEPAV